MIDRIYIPNPFGWGGPSTFAILMLISFLVASYILPREYRRKGLVPEHADTFIFLGVLGTLVGSKLFYIFEIWDQIFVLPGIYWEPLTHWDGFQFFNNVACKDSFTEEQCKIIANSYGLWSSLFSGGGLVFYGGFLTGTLFIYIFMRVNKLEYGHYYDGMAPSMAIGYAIGRLGCFVSGDGCYGFYTEVNIPILVFTFQGAHPSHVPVWNTPVIEAIISFLFFLYFQYWARLQNFKKWSLFFQYLILHGFARLMIEFLRVNKAVIPFVKPPDMVNIPDANVNPIFLKGYYWHGFSQSQYISLLLIAAGIFFIVKGKLWEKTATAVKSK